ncbi:glycosyltransferase [Terriglobus roseus]|uniref:Glycosyltransferase involved in cell wall bisynthesis n=1 Tax=Terriglobus roseus TaxID=392734 RepID=A0A1H4LWT6_9BACT|nr:glycosyltransferase [Terriglobus roseus]SEB75320.1 Glycosyltransferase involved in cell wall bisynthesis [Terriglobus roseus]
MGAPRVAFFPDSFHEVNGVAHTARNFTAYAQRHGLPFLAIRAGAPGSVGAAIVTTQGSVTAVDLPRGRASIAMEKDLSFDPFFARYGRVIRRALRDFRPDVIHITGPSELGIFGAYFAWKMGIPLAASWHTNVHEYAGRRSARLGSRAALRIEESALAATARFYSLASVLYAPNEELCTLLARTQRPCHVMRRGVDTTLFSPSKRTRAKDDGTVVLGYVGRLSVEKNIAMLPRIEAELRELGITNTKFVIVGQGGDEASLRASLPTAEFAGVLRGEALAAAYANMDIFVFPSDTDTFGNVVLEALASGVPAVVTTGGGPKFIVRDGVTGYARTPSLMPEPIADLVRDASLRHTMATAAREYALGCRWDAIFDGVYAHYPAAAHLDLMR